MDTFCLRRRLREGVCMMGLCALLLGLVCFPMTASPARAHPGDGATFFANLQEFVIPTTSSYPVGITVGPDGALWFTEHGASRIGRLTTGGSFTEYPLAPDSQPDAITAGPDGALWFTEQETNMIGRLTPSGALSEYQVPYTSPPGGSSGLVAIASRADGSLWFTEADANKIV